MTQILQCSLREYKSNLRCYFCYYFRACIFFRALNFYYTMVLLLKCAYIVQRQEGGDEEDSILGLLLITDGN